MATVTKPATLVLVLAITGCGSGVTDKDPPVAPSSPPPRHGECANPDGCVIGLRPETVKQRMLSAANVAGEMGKVHRFRDSDWRKNHHPDGRKHLRDGYVPGCHYQWEKLEKRYTVRSGYFSKTSGRHAASHVLWQFAFVYGPNESDVLARDTRKLFGKDCPTRLSVPYRSLPGNWYQPATRHTWQQSLDTFDGWKRLQGWHRVTYPTRNFDDHNIITYLQRNNVLIVVAYGDRFFKRDRQRNSAIIVANTLLIRLTEKLNQP